MMTRSATRSFAFALFLILGAAPLSAATFTATQSGNWSSASTWGGAGVPGAGDTAINPGGTITIDIPVTVATLTNSGSLGGTQSLTVTTAFNCNGGTISGASTLSIPSGSVMTVGSYTTIDARTIDIAGTLNVTSSYYLSLQNNANITNSGTIDFQGDGGIYINGGTSSVTNSGTITKSSGTGTSGFTVGYIAQSGSQFQVQTGIFTLAGVTTSGGSFDVSFGATLAFTTSNTRTFDATSSITALGTVSWNAGTNTVNGTYNVTGTTSNASTTTLNNITNVGSISMSNGTLTLNSASSLNVGTISMTFGTLTGTAPITITSGPSTLSNGTLAGSGALSIPLGKTVNIVSLTIDGKTINNAGNLNLISGGTTYLANDATIVNDGTIDFQSDNSMTTSGTVGSIALTNNGTIKKSGGSSSSSFFVPLIAASGSQFQVQTVTMYLGKVTSTGATFSASSGATLIFYTGDTRTFDAASTISGLGTVQWNSGTNTVNASYNVGGTTIHSSGATTLNSIASTGSITMNGGTFTLNSASAITVPTLNINSGTIAGTAPINVTSASMTWNNGTFAGSGLLSIPVGTTISFVNQVFDGRPISNAGTIYMTPAGTMYFTNNATLTNDGMIDLQSDANILVSGPLGTIALTNNGTIKKSNGASGSQINVPLVMQSGSQLLQQSSILYLGAITSTGATFNVSSGATLYFYTSDTRTFDAASSIGGLGNVQWNGGTNTVNGAYNITATTFSSGGATTLNNITSVGSINMTNGTLTLNSATAITVPTLTMSFGTLNGTAPINVTNSTMTWSNGTLGGSGLLSIPAGTTITVTNLSIDGRPISNAGTFNTISNGSVYMAGNATFTNSGTIDLQGDGAIFISGPTGTTSIMNSGTIQKSGGTSGSQINVPLVMQSGGQLIAQAAILYMGAITSTGGTFTANSGATLNFYTTDTRTFDAASTITGLGTIQWNGGTNTVNANYNVSGTTASSGGATTINSISSTGSINMGSGTLTLNGASAISVPALSMGGGTLDGTAPINLTNATMTWSNGTIGGSGTLTIPNTTTLTVTNVAIDARPVTNNGTINLTTTGAIYIGGNAVLTNNGTIDLKADANVYQNGPVGTTSVTNNGTIKKSVGTFGSVFNAPLIAQSGSQFQVQASILYLSAVTSTGGSFSASSGATLVFYTNDTRTFDAASTIGGAGTMQWNSGTNTFSGTMTGNAVMNGATLTINSASTQTLATLTMNSGLINGSANLTLSGTSMTWIGGAIGGSGTFTIPSGTTITVNGFFYIDARPFTNNGTINYTSTNGSYVQNNAVITNNGTIDFQGDNALYLNSGLGTTSVVNNGTIKKSGGSGGSAINFPVTMNGGSVFQVLSGTFNLAAVTATGTSFSINPSSTLAFTTNDTRTFDAATSISGSGTAYFQSGTNTFTGTITAPLAVSGGTLLINSASPQSIPTLTMSGGFLGGTANINLTGASMTWSGGTIGGSRTLAIPGGTTITVAGYLFFDTLAMTNGGTINYNYPYYSYLQNNAVLTNNGTIDFQGDNNGFYLNSAVGTTALVNNGTLKKSGGAGAATINVPFVANSGSQFQVMAGSIYLAAVASTGGSFSIDPGGMLIFNTNDTRNFDAATTITGSGTALFQSGTNTFAGTITTPLAISGGTFSINSASTQTIPTLTMSGSGILAGTANINLTGTSMTWSSGTIGGTGTLTIPSGATITMNGYMFFDARPVTNNGTINYAHPYYSYLQNNAQITNNGTIDFQGDNGFYINGALGTTAIINNGTFKKSGGAGSATMNVTLTANSGSQFNVQSGMFYVGPVTSTGATFNVSSGATMNFNTNDTRTIDAASTITGAGLFTHSGGTTSITGTLSAPTSVTGGTLTINSASPQSLPLLSMNGGYLNGSAAINLTGALNTWTSGTVGGTGTLTIPSGSTVMISGYPFFDARPINNAGTMTWTSTYYAYMQNGAVLTNSGTIDFQGDAAIYLNTGAASIVNNGLIKKSGGTNTSYLLATTNNASGTIQAATGTINFSNSLTQNGTLSFVIAGATAFGKIAVNNSLALAGTLTATTTGGYTPPNGTTFQVLTFPSKSGAFAQKNLLYAGGGFTDSYTSTAMNLTAGLGSCYSTPGGAVSWYRAEGNAVDSIGTNTGTMTNATTGAGYVGNAFILDGSTSYVSAPDSATLRPASITAEGWVKFSSLPGSLAVIVSKTYTTSFLDSFVIWYDNSGLLKSEVSDNAGEMYLSAPWSPVVGTWYHVAVTFDTATQQEVLYLDGSPVASATFSGRQIAYDSHPLLIGADINNESPQFYFPGAIDEVTLYNRALSAAEIQNIYFANATGKCFSAAAPTISSFTPASGGAGTSVVITGTDFIGASAVSFNGTPAASFIVNSATQITATVPATMTTGPISVTTAGGTGTSASPFTFTCTPPPATVTAPPSVCANATNVGASVSATVGATYNWTVTNGTLTSGQGTSSITFNPAATGSVSLSVTVTDSTSCANTGSANVTINPVPSATITAPPSICATTSANASIAPQAGGTFTWTITNGTINSGQGTNAINFTAATSGNVTLNVAVSTSAGCSNSGSVAVPINAAPVATITAPANACANSSSSASVPFQSGATYNWTIANGVITNGAASDVVTFTANGSGSVTLNVTVNNGGCSASSTANVPINAPPTAAITAPASMCASANGNASTNIVSGATYTWSITNASISGGLGTNAITFTAGASGNVVLNVTVTAGGCSTSTSATVPINAPPNTTITAPPSMCPAGSANASVPSQSGATYNWTVSNGTLNSGQGTNAINFTAGGGGNVSIGITITANGCSNSGNVNVPINAAAAATISAPPSVCANTSANASVASQAGATYAWTIANGTINSGQGTNAINFTAGASGSVTLAISVTNGTCSGTGNASVAINTPPAPTITAPSNMCASASANASVNPIAGATYNWTITNGSISGGQGTNAINFTAGASGTVTLNVTVTNGGCSGSASKSITVSAPPTVSITGPSTVCPGGSVTLDAGPGFATYAWSTGATTQSITVPQNATSVNYSVTVTNGSGCSTSASKVVTLSQAPNANISVNGNSASVPAGASGTTYNWSATGGTITSGQGTNAITFTNGTTSVSVTVTTNGCVSTGSSGVQSGADLAISMSASGESPITFTLTIANNGPQDATNVSVNDPLPSGATFVSATGGGWTCNSSVVCTTSLVGAGSTTSITIVVNAQSTIMNFATISSSTTDPNLQNNSASATATVTACGTTAPSLVSPADNASNLSSPVTFTWSSVPNATGYELWLAVDDGAPSLVSTTASTSATINVAGNKATWYAGAKFANNCATIDSASRSFTLAKAVNCDGHGVVTLLSPAPAATISSPVTFTWTSISQAVGYRVWISIDGGAAQDVGSTNGATTLTATIPPGAITWFVDALFAGCPPTHSSTMPFTVPTPDPCANHSAASLIAPSNNATSQTSQIIFQWTSAASASGYRLYASIDNAPFNALGTTSNTTLTKAISSGHVVWYVETLFDGCTSIESAHRIFDVPKAQDCGTQVATLIAPADNATTSNTNVTFQWNGIENATSYEVWLALNDAAPTFLASTTATSLTHEVPAGTLEWFVRTNVDRCDPRDSAHRHFTYTPPPACSDAHPVVIAPLENSTTFAPVNLTWKEVAGASSYRIRISVDGAAFTTFAQVPSAHLDDANIPTGAIDWIVDAIFNDNCPQTSSSPSHFTVLAKPQGCVAPTSPAIFGATSVSSAIPYTVRWQKVAGGSSYLLQESQNGAFTDASGQSTDDDNADFVHTNSGNAPITFFYRVRAISNCTTQPGPYSPVLAVIILPSKPAGTSLTGVLPSDQEQNISYTIPLDASLAGSSFVATVNEPFLSVTPSSGVIATGGTTLNVTANTTGLPLGTTLGGVTVTMTAPTSSSNRAAAKVTTTTTTTVSVSLVTPVQPKANTAPPPDALIIPAVAHADGINSKFQSDVRITNTASQTQKYQVTFTPTGDNGAKSAKQTTIDVDAGKTVALDDLLGTWFSSGAFTGQIGTLELRPLTQLSGATVAGNPLANLATFASSRTFNTTSNGTFGQYIPAIPFGNFIGNANAVLSLQQIAQSQAFRTNIGLVEGSGNPAAVLISVFGGDGKKISEFPMTLTAGQHTQFNLAQQGVNVSDGRVEVKVTSPAGKVTAYASVLDNLTNDPMLVSPITLSQSGATKFVIPGVADINNGLANWRSDTRIYNPSSKTVNATLRFYSQSGGDPKVAQITLAPNEVKQLDNTLASVFGVSNDGGALHITTTESSNLITSARTYNLTTNGTYGQFINGVTPNDAAGLGGRAIQVLQVEESDRYRSNIGIAEVNGKSASVELALVPADGRVTAKLTFDLAPNEFRQFNLRSFGVGTTYNGRVSVRVTGGDGRITGYASVIDATTQDPTFIPAQ